MQGCPSPWSILSSIAGLCPPDANHNSHLWASEVLFPDTGEQIHSWFEPLLWIYLCLCNHSPKIKKKAVRNLLNIYTESITNSSQYLTRVEGSLKISLVCLQYGKHCIKFCGQRRKGYTLWWMPGWGWVTAERRGQILHTVPFSSPCACPSSSLFWESFKCESHDFFIPNV